MKLKNIKVRNSEIVVETPLPKYNGERGKFHNWRDKLLSCIKCNDWKDEGRILEIIPLALTGEAKNVFQSLSKKQKSSLDLVLASLKEVLEPNYKSYYRNLFFQSKRDPGETMRAFVSRCELYVKRADDVEDLSKCP